MSEIDAFPRAVLKHHFPEIPLHGDFTTIEADEYGPIDILVGGTPCQAFSVAGLRGGISDDRGNLALEFLLLAKRLRPRWLVFENVPGIFSSLSHAAPDPCPPEDPVDLGCDGQEVETEDDYASEELHAFNCFLAALSELGYGFAYRVLDAQFAGLAQRRKRVFVVGYLGDWRCAAAVLFEPHGLSGYPPPSRKTRQDVARPITPGSPGGSGYRNDADTADNLFTGTLNANGKAAGSATSQDAESGLLVTHTLRGESFDSSEDGTGRGTPLVPVAFALRGREGGAQAEVHEAVSALRSASGGSTRDMVAFAQNSRSEVRQIAGGGQIVGAVAADVGTQQQSYLANRTAVRRLTPKECERLQGFPDGYTDIEYRGKVAADGPRYKALGNSMAVPVMAQIGQRIALVDALDQAPK